MSTCWSSSPAARSPTPPASSTSSAGGRLAAQGRWRPLSSSFPPSWPAPDERGHPGDDRAAGARAPGIALPGRRPGDPIADPGGPPGPAPDRAAGVGPQPPQASADAGPGSGRPAGFHPPPGHRPGGDRPRRHDGRRPVPLPAGGDGPAQRLRGGRVPVFRWIYHNYWRVETTGVANVPPGGRALLVANHAGVLPWDGAMIKTSLFEEHPQPRHARALVASFFFGLPGLSWFLRRTGQTVGHPDDAHRLLERDELVLVFPEGVKGTGKGWSNRYRLRRFGRGGYVQTAIRAGAPIIPISVVGSEEIYPMIADLGPIAELFGLPYFPVTPTFPLLGPLGMVPLPSKWRIQFHEPVRTDLCEPGDAEDQRMVMTLNDHVMETIQGGIVENLKLRKGVFF
ncbi:MAG: glycerol acyltransferase [Chloroflexi bacterium]|nr:MAG: glycerol acyltransferase [Chloroflexota bacterium]